MPVSTRIIIAIIIFCYYSPDGVTVTITSQVSFTLHEFWGVEIGKVYKEIFQPWSSFEEKFSQNRLFDKITQVKSEQKLYPSNNYLDVGDSNSVCKPFQTNIIF